MSWIVYAEPKSDGSWDVYNDDYFPRTFAYKKDAETCAYYAKERELQNVCVRRDGAKLSSKTKDR